MTKDNSFLNPQHFFLKGCILKIYSAVNSDYIELVYICENLKSKKKWKFWLKNQPTGKLP